MKNFKQEIYSEITGCHGAFNYGSPLNALYWESVNRLDFVKSVGLKIKQKNLCYAGGARPKRYELNDTEAQEICSAIENVEGFINAMGAYNSLSSNTEWE